MNHVLSLGNAFAASWADALVRACWQGGLAITLAWLICRLWPGMPPNPRCWLWRLAYAKLLLGLVWLPPLVLPLLPHPPVVPQAAQIAAPPEKAAPAALPDAPLAASATALAPSRAALLSPPAPTPLQLPLSHPTLPTVQTWLLAAWLLGVLISLGRVAAAWHRARVLYETSAPLADAALRADAATLCRRLGLRRVPPLRVADDLLSPLLLGLTRPAILLPAFVLSGSPRSELRLMLAHELAHLARRDLLWNILPLLAQRLFFFHPLVWLAGHEWSLAQEIACDAQAVALTGTSPSAYGRMLLGIATRRRTSAAPLFPTLAVAAPRHTLRRRLFAMQHIGTTSRPRLILAAALTALLALGVLLPWRVVAQTGPSPSTPPVATQGDAAWEKLEQKQQADIASKNARLDAQLVEAQKHLPVQPKKVQTEITSINVEYAKGQQRVQRSEQSRAAYIASHPNRLSDAQTAFVQKVNWDKMHPSRISEGIRWEQTIRRKLQAHLASAHDARSRQGWQRQIAAIDQRRREGERQIRELAPVIAQQQAELAAIPKDQQDRVAKLRSYDLEISCGRIEALVIKQVRVSILQQIITGKRKWHEQKSHASVEPQRPRIFQVYFRVPRHGTHQVRVLTQDATGQHLILEKLCQAGESLNVPVTAKGNRVGFLIYEDGKLVKNQSL